ncbi:MAG: fimbrillin family protein [Rikenellaceae bacterium]|jgi:hypothetical protein|nr:fimbrillin family protein [Rikenellaceae bacterium]
MKRAILGLASVAAIFASCAKTEISEVNVNNPNVIGFEANTGKTRATTNDLAVIQANASGFGVYATNKTAPAVEFIANEGYKYNATKSAWEWDAANPFLWPTQNADYPINFYAYYPKSSATLSTALTQSYSVADAPANQIDYLAASKIGVVTRPTSSNIALNFVHILSKIDFKVITGAAVTVEVQSISARNIGNNGTFDFAGMAWSAAPTAFGRTSSYMTATNPAPANINKFASTNATAVRGSSGSLMLMPQNLTARAWDKTVPVKASQSIIEVVYRVYETASGKDVVGFSDASNHPDYAGSQAEAAGYTGPLFVKVAFSLNSNWLMGKNYTYTIYLGDPGTSGGNLIDDKQVDTGGKDTDLPVVDPGTGTTVTPPGPITDPNKPIGFIVTVDQWGNEPDIAIQ